MKSRGKVAVGYDVPGAVSSTEPRQGYPGRPQSRIPILQTSELDPAVYANSTCFAAGYLTATNAGWRNIRPVVAHEKCTGCMQCYMYCPDGAIFKVPDEPKGSTRANKTGTSVEVDLDFCKGCGICAKACKFGAISMVLEAEALEQEAAACLAAAPEGA